MLATECCRTLCSTEQIEHHLRFELRCKSSSLYHSNPLSWAYYTSWLSLRQVSNPWGALQGLPGVSGDPLEIKHATDILISFCNGLLEWEVEVRSVVPPNPLQPLKQKMEGWTSQLLEEVVSFPDKLEEPFNQPNPTGQYDIHLIFKEMPYRILCNGTEQKSLEARAG